MCSRTIFAVVLAATLSMAAAHAQSGRAVNMVFRQADAASINFTAGARQIIVQASPSAVVSTSACGSAGSFPVQNVFVMDQSNTYVADAIVCVAVGLPPGHRLKQAGSPKALRGGSSRVMFEQTD